MRHPILAALVLAALGSNAQAAWLDVTPQAGYTTFSMGELNRANSSLHGYDMAGTQDDLDNGFVAGLDLTTSRLLGLNGLSWGLRMEYLQSNQAENKDPSTYHFDYTDQATLTNALLGGTYNASVAGSGLSLGLAAWIGAGHAVLNQNVSLNVYSTSDPIQSGSFSANVLVGELEARAAYQLGKRIGLAVSGGWRWADATQVSSGGTPLYNNLQYWYYNSSTSPVNVDFSGATLKGSVSYSF